MPEIIIGKVSFKDNHYIIFNEEYQVEVSNLQLMEAKREFKDKVLYKLMLKTRHNRVYYKNTPKFPTVEFIYSKKED